MSEEREHLIAAIADELERRHGLTGAEARSRAARMTPHLAERFSTWVRRELTLQRSDERRAERPLLRERAAPAATTPAAEWFERVNLNVRVQHALMAISVILLILTGIPLKFHESGWARFVIGMFGGPDVSPIVHRVAASGLIIVGVWHILYTILARSGRRDFMLLLPRPQDAKDAWQQIRYFLGRTDERPRFDRFSYVEKFDYWAVYWGMVIMIGSGLVLWFTDLFLRYFPKWATDIAKEAHSDEALLATLAIVIWHFYNVHFNPHKFPMNRVFIDGKISTAEMLEEHPLEYERIMAERRREGSEP